MANRKRNIQMKFYVTEEEKRLIDEKMAQLPTRAMVPIFAKWRLTDISSTPTPRRARRLPRSFPSSVGISIRSQSGSTPEIPSIKRIWRKSDQYSVVMWRTVCPPIFCTASITSDLHFKSFSLFYHSIHQSFEPGIHDNDKLACSWQFLQHFVKSFLFNIFLHIHPTGNATGF